jgi:hypothetical protein
MKNINLMSRLSGLLTKKRIKKDSRYVTDETGVPASISEVYAMMLYYKENDMTEEYEQAKLTLNNMSNKLGVEQYRLGLSNFGRYDLLITTEGDIAISTEEGNTIIKD